MSLKKYKIKKVPKFFNGDPVVDASGAIDIQNPDYMSGVAEQNPVVQTDGIMDLHNPKYTTPINPQNAQPEAPPPMRSNRAGQVGNLLSVGATAVGSALYAGANSPDEYSNEKTSAIGMGLQTGVAGAKFGSMLGPLGTVAGGALGGIGGAAMGWYTAKNKNIEMQEAEHRKELAYMNNAQMGVDKGIYKDGGKTKDKFENTETYYSQMIMDKGKYIIPQMFGSLGTPEQGVPIVHIQTEKGEKAIMPDGGIVDTKATKLHEKMHKDKVTDVLPEGVYIASDRDKNKMPKTKAEKEVLGHTPDVYDENKSHE